MAEAPKPQQQRLVYDWYVFVMKSGSVERCIGTRLEENGDLLEVYDQTVRTLSVQKSDVVDRWIQERRVTRVGQQRIKDALDKTSAASPPRP